MEENRVGVERRTGLEYREQQGWSKEQNRLGVEENRVGYRGEQGWSMEENRVGVKRRTYLE